MEFLIDTGMELARNIVFKIVELCQDEASKKLSVRVTANNYVLREWLQPQMDKLEEEIKDLAEGTYRTALSHLHHVFIILRERYDSLESSNAIEDRVSLGSLPMKNDAQGLPEVSITLLNMAYDKAYNSFHYSANLAPAKRITAMQVAMLCIGMHYVTQPRILLSRWEKCYSDILRDPVITKCLEKNLEGSQGLLRFFYQLKARDVDSFIIFARDLLRQISRIAARDEVDKAFINKLIERIVFPKEFQTPIQKIWSEKLNWLDYVNSCTFREELRLKEVGAAFDACAALPDGGVVFALGNDALIQYNRNFERTNFQAGSYYSLTYDPHRQCLWGFSKQQNTLTQISLETLKDTGTHVPAPQLAASLRVARWHIAIAKTGWLVIAAQLLRDADAKWVTPYIYVKRNPDEQSWTQVSYECPTRSFGGRKITDISVYDTMRSGELSSLEIALATEGSLHLMTTKVNTTAAFVVESLQVAENLVKDRTSCAFDTDGLLIAAVRRKCLLIYDPKKKMIIKQSPALRGCGTWVAVGQRAIWLPTLHGDIYQYEYFVF